MSEHTTASLPRNYGPSWGHGALIFWDRWLPRPIYDAGIHLGSIIGWALLPVPRRYSRDYLRVLLGRPSTWREQWRHFHALTASLVRGLRVLRGEPRKFRYAAGSHPDFPALAAGRAPAFYGTFHVGDSDLLGFELGSFGRRVSVVRQRMANNAVAEWLGEHYGHYMRFIWVDRPQDVLFAIKQAVQAEESIALKCDRTEGQPKTEAFGFLGAEREFPVTIYHLAALFGRPVAFAMAWPVSGEEVTEVIASAVWRPPPGRWPRRLPPCARAHFQGVLDQLEARLRRQPEQWFNFLPLPRAVPEQAPVAPSSPASS